MRDATQRESAGRRAFAQSRLSVWLASSFTRQCPFEHETVRVRGLAQAVKKSLARSALDRDCRSVTTADGDSAVAACLKDIDTLNAWQYCLTRLKNVSGETR